MHIRNVVTLTVAALLLLPSLSSAAGPPPPREVQETAAPAPKAPTSADRLAEARVTVAELLARHGLTEAEVGQRLDQLTEHDLIYLADHAEQIQEGGASPPEYIWVLLGIFLVVAIVAAVL